MPIPSSHNDLFHNSGTLEKINLFQTLLDSQDLTSMEALALLNTIHKELETPQGHDRAVYVQYAQMMEKFQQKMPELHKEVTRKWSELQFILKSREPKKEDDPNAFDVNAEEGRKSSKGSRSQPQNNSVKATEDVLHKSASHISKDFELEKEELIGGVEAEEEGIEEVEEENEEKEDKEIEAGEGTEEAEEKESEERESEEETEKDEEEEVEEEKEEKDETENEEEKEESEEKESKEEEHEEKEETENEEEKEKEIESEEGKEEESKNAEGEEAGGEVEQKEVAEEAEEPDRMAVEAAEAEHVASEIEPAEEPEPPIDEEEPPMEASG